MPERTKTDPRLDVARDSVLYYLTPEEVLADLDAADRAAGIVRVDTADEASPDQIAGVLARDLDDEPYWSCVVIAKRILAALREVAQ